MKALKALVIGMGVLIVIGIALVGIGLSRGKSQPAGSVAQTSVPEIKNGSYASEVAMPPGARLEQITAAGDRVVLRFSSAQGDKLILIDARTGQLAGMIALVPGTH